MADLLTHFTVARLPGGFLRGEAARTLFALGVFLPDLVQKSIDLAPGLSRYGGTPSHSAAGILCIGFAVSMLFAEPIRPRAFGALVLGQAIHALTDMAKQALAVGFVFPFLPFSLESVAFGWYTTEHVLHFLPFNLALLGLIWLLGKAARRRAWLWS